MKKSRCERKSHAKKSRYELRHHCFIFFIFYPSSGKIWILFHLLPTPLTSILTRQRPNPLQSHSPCTLPRQRHLKETFPSQATHLPHEIRPTDPATIDRALENVHRLARRGLIRTQAPQLPRDDRRRHEQLIDIDLRLLGPRRIMPCDCLFTRRDALAQDRFVGR